MWIFITYIVKLFSNLVLISRRNIFEFIGRPFHWLPVKRPCKTTKLNFCLETSLLLYEIIQPLLEHFLCCFIGQKYNQFHLFLWSRLMRKIFGFHALKFFFLFFSSKFRFLGHCTWPMLFCGLHWTT